MNKYILLLLIFFSATTHASTPQISFRYSAIFDKWCTIQNGSLITNAERTELSSKFFSLQAEWDKVGPQLLNATTTLLEKDFHQKEMIATVFLCKKTPSMSMPLLINGNWFAKGSSSIPNYMITALVFHELLHTFIEDNYSSIQWPTPLIKKYHAQGESARTLDHLHLTAIQKMVYVELGMNEFLSEVIALESSFSNSGYKRAWKIIEAEGYKPFIDELKK